MRWCLVVLVALSWMHDVTALEAHPRLAPQLRQEWSRALHFPKPGTPGEQRAVLVRMARELSGDDEKSLALDGVQWARLHGRLAHIAQFYAAAVTPSSLRALLDHPLVARVSSMPPNTRPLAPGNPYGETLYWTHADAVWPRRTPEGARLQGSGMLLTDLDGASDIFHPLFFRADAGHYDWIDVDGDGVFDPGIDAVDLDGSGAAEAEETLHALGGGLADAYYRFSAPGPYRAASHFLYADANGNGKRDYGRQAGFDETTPAYGEPLFIADDVNANNVLDPGERLLRLGSNKYRAVFRPATNRTYVRGIDLIDTPINTDAGHGSGVGGILVGGVDGRTWVQGLAPDADLVVIVQDAAPDESFGNAYQQNLLSGIQWAEELGTHVFVHEYGTAVGYHADGSSDWEQMLDAMSARGAVQATAAHNFADTAGRTRFLLGAGQSRALSLTVDANGYPDFTMYALFTNIRWRGAASDVTVTLSTPDGTMITPASDGQQGRHFWYGTNDASGRGTGMVDFAYSYATEDNSNYALLPMGTYTVTVTNTAATERDIHFFASDESLYAAFVRVMADLDDHSSMAWPSTADSAIAVAAYQVNTLVRVSQPGELAPYSGRGPRIDGARTISVAAPADHYGALPSTYGEDEGHYQVFDGTSGALPQVAAAVALLLQKEPALTPEQVKMRLTSSAYGDEWTGTLPNDDWGSGRLDVHQLLFGEPAVDNAPPTLRVDAPACVISTRAVEISVARSSDDHDAPGTTIFRFDADLDGTWEQEGTGTTFTASSTRVLVQAEDGLGSTSEKLVQVELRDPCPAEGGSPSSSLMGPAGGGSSSSAGGGSGGDAPVPGGCQGCSASDVTGMGLGALLVLALRRRRAF